ncbi:hypothetical protein FB567DRAFT_434709 [Paraphoma chrysanthemicola]|uniref:Uncharacterized protein n=1 Tax=Paraphoma chrysanthemicola TaxID=798071 RepID=A0A8K0RCP1_9PLEO|nr:hypothetical protein FB567DRAFT_434709 [Paraphoma chrysanthemicola]
MQPHRFQSSRRTPPPDVVRSANALPPPGGASRQSSAPAVPPIQPAPSNAEFLIIGIFSLRLTKRLIEGLDYYSTRDADIAWIANFLAPYPSNYALAKISGPRKEDYMAMYQDIVSRMKRQPRYPMRFMQMNPDRSIQQRMAQGRTTRYESREMTDAERMEIIDFCDAACEWGSIVPIPAREADRMIELAEQRCIADLDTRNPPQDTEYRTGVSL